MCYRFIVSLFHYVKSAYLGKLRKSPSTACSDIALTKASVMAAVNGPRPARLRNAHLVPEIRKWAAAFEKYGDQVEVFRAVPDDVFYSTKVRLIAKRRFTQNHFEYTRKGGSP